MLSIFLSQLCQTYISSRIDPSEYLLDIPHPIVSECICLHISLNSLEVLGDPNILPASPEFCEQLKSQPSPFHEIYKTSSASVLDSIALIEVNKTPWVTYVKRPFMFRPEHGQYIPPEEIIFKDLDSGEKRRMRCKPWEAMSDLVCPILRFLGLRYTDSCAGPIYLECQSNSFPDGCPCHPCHSTTSPVDAIPQLPLRAVQDT